jgi:neurotransmitter:Na+ symporter, NSS family
MAMSSPADRGQWGSRLGFILAAVGSAVGLGNMWRFPYQMAEAGGAAFLVLYIGMVMLIGLPILLAEFVVGRGSRQSPIQALVHLGGKSWRPLGILFVVAGFVILAYYAVIAGWTIRYVGTYVIAGGVADPSATFDAFATGGWAVAMQVLFMAVTIAVVLGGVEAGIERAALVLMPLLFAIVIGLAIYAAFLDGAAEGYAYYLQTDFSEIMSLGVLSSAAGQAFFSLSLGMGAMLTFASYLTRKENLSREAAVIAAADFGVAFIAGLMVFPLIFALGLQGSVGESTVGALFITLPQAFEGMGAGGQIVGILFFAALLVGALTSAVSLLEVVASSAIDSLGWSRKKAALITGTAITALGIPCAIDLRFLEIFDQIAGTVLLVVGALFIAVFVGWKMKDPIQEASLGAKRYWWFDSWIVLLRYVVPVLLTFVLVYALIEAFTAISGLF